MSEHPDQSGIAAFSRFDADAASKLRGNLAVISRHTDSEELRGLIRRVLSGKEHVRAVFGHPAMAARGSRISWRAFVGWICRRQRRSSSAAVRRCPPTSSSTPFAARTDHS